MESENGGSMIKTKLIMVECVSTFRMRYVVEVPNDHPEYALDVVTTNEAKEFSQVHLGETIVSDREISEKEVLAICDIDNDYVKTWNDETKLNTFITRIKDYE
jgi:hypothetical protein